MCTWGRIIFRKDRTEVTRKDAEQAKNTSRKENIK